MNPGVSRWTIDNLRKAAAIFSQHDDLQEALVEVSKALGFPVTRAAADSAFNEAGLPTPYQHLRKPVRRRLGASSLPPVADRDTEQMPVAQEWPLPDDGWTTSGSLTDFPLPLPAEPDAWSRGPASPWLDPQVPSPEPSSTASELLEHRLRNQLADEKAARKRLLQDLADRDEQLAILNELRAANPLPPVVEERKVVGAKQRQGVPVMLCSDWHIEEPVDPKTINGLNEYNLDIADACITRLAESYAWFLEDPRYDCRTGVVALLGDLLSGYIHDELQEKNFLSPTQATLWLQERVERMLRLIAKLCPNLERIIVVCCDGNHGRTTHKIRVSTRTANSFEWLLYHTLAARMADDPRFEFRIADGEWAFVDLFGDRIAFTHGDSFQYGGGVGGMAIPIRRGIARQFQGQDIKKFCMGHFHKREDLGDIAINGSMIGYSPYAARVHAKFERRQQTWFLWDYRQGQAFDAPVWL